MKIHHKVAPALILFVLPFLLVVAAYYAIRYIDPNISFTTNRAALGGVIATYAGTTLAILIAAMTFMIGLGGRNIYKMKAYGYMTSIITLYALTFFELGVIFFSGIFLFATSKSLIPMLPSIAIGLSGASLAHIAMILIQILNLSKHK